MLCSSSLNSNCCKRSSGLLQCKTYICAIEILIKTDIVRSNKKKYYTVL